MPLPLCCWKNKSHRSCSHAHNIAFKKYLHNELSLGITRLLKVRRVLLRRRMMWWWHILYTFFFLLSFMAHACHSSLFLYTTYANTSYLFEMSTFGLNRSFMLSFYHQKKKLCVNNIISSVYLTFVCVFNPHIYHYCWLNWLLGCFSCSRCERKWANQSKNKGGLEENANLISKSLFFRGLIWKWFKLILMQKICVEF